MANLFSRFGRKKNISLEDSIERIQKGDTQLQNEVLEQFTPFVAKTVSTVCKRYISESDDEFSIGLIAFNEAIERFNPDKGRSIISFSETVIKSRVIDYIRKEAKSPDMLELSSSGFILDEDSGVYGQNQIEAEISIEEYQKELESKQRSDEILRFQGVLTEFKLTMNDLFNQAPKHIDARINAINVAQTLVNDTLLRETFLETKKLPIKDLSNIVSVSRKTIERNRKYIIAIAIILDGDYVFLKDYLRTDSLTS